MKLFNKVVVVIYTIAFMLLGGLLAYINLLDYRSLEWYLNEVMGVITSNGVLFFILGVAIAVLPILTGIFTIIGSREQKQIVRHTDLGELKISTETVRGIAMGSVKNIQDIRDIELRVNIVKDEIVIVLRGKVNNNIVIPELTVKLQSEIKDSVEKCTGVPVKEVKIEIGSSIQNTQVKEVQ